jgi:hypothetical protein
MQQYIILKKEDPLSWALFPQTIERVKNFCRSFGTDTDPDQLADLIQKHFVADDPLMVLVAGVEKGRGVFAHALACIDEITGRRFLTIMHMESDEPYRDQEAIKNVLTELKVWGLKHGAMQAQIVTSDEAHVRMFERFYGFKKHRILMRMSLVEE